MRRVQSQRHALQYRQVRSRMVAHFDDNGGLRPLSYDSTESAGILELALIRNRKYNNTTSVTRYSSTREVRSHRDRAAR